MNREEYNAEEEKELMIADQIRSKVWTAMPAIVQSVNYSEFTITAQPAIQGITTDKDNNEIFVDLPLLIHVPILFPQAGGWNLTFPIKPDDECLIVFACRCIDAWWQSGGVQKPMEQRMLDLSDGFAILAPYSQPKAKQVAEGFSDSSVILRDNSKQNYLELTNDGCCNILLQKDLTAEIGGNANLKIKGNAKAEIGGDLSAQAANILLKASSVTIDSPSTTITGDLKINGATNASGQITCSSDVTASGISLQSHVHGGVQGGSSNTSGPQ